MMRPWCVLLGKGAARLARSCFRGIGVWPIDGRLGRSAPVRYQEYRGGGVECRDDTATPRNESRDGTGVAVMEHGDTTGAEDAFGKF